MSKLLGPAVNADHVPIIGIAGGGLAGLGAALAILRGCRGADDPGSTKKGKGRAKRRNGDGSDRFRGQIVIYERDARLNDRREGYGMTLTYDPAGPLARLGVLEELAGRDCPSRCHYLFNEKGEVRGYFGNAFYSSSRPGGGGGDDIKASDGGSVRGAGQRGNLRVPRSELRSVLLDALLAEAERHRNDADDEQVGGNEANGGSSRVEIVWNKRLESYVDRPLMDKLDQIYTGGTKQFDDRNSRPEGRQPQRPVLLRFEDGSTDEVDLLVGADGVNSAVAKQYLSTTWQKRSDNDGPTAATEPNSTEPDNALQAAPRFVGIFLILGISDHFHPLLDERGFYTLDGEHRLFIMPFQGSRLDDDVDAASAAADAAASESIDNDQAETQQSQQGQKRRRRRTMWQLSFPVPDPTEAARLGRLSPEGMRRDILRSCGHWHEPFPAMVRDTPRGTIWGTSLVDRDPQAFLDHRTALEVHGRVPSRVVLVGDAAHPMTPFKGQGANQALADGPLLAQWMSHSKIDSAVRGYMAEMSRRSGIKVRASREAAAGLHSSECWGWMVKQDRPVKGGDDAIPAVFHGVAPRHVPELLRTLKERGVDASLGAALDETIRGIIQEMDIADEFHEKISPEEMARLRTDAVEYASAGCTSQLRQLSRRSQLIIPGALDAHGRTCLHLAAEGGHVDTCRWLLTEVNASCNALDESRKRPIDLAVQAGQEGTVHLLKKWMEQMDRSGATSAVDVATDANDGSKSNSPANSGDVYRQVERQLRGIRTERQLCDLLRKNRCTPDHAKPPHCITHVLGCHLDESDAEYEISHKKVLAEEHGAVLMRNFVPREVDQLALGALALRPMNYDLSGALTALRAGTDDAAFDAITAIGSNRTLPKSKRKHVDKRIEEIKSGMTTPSDASIIVQTNWGPQMQSYATDTIAATKKRRIDSFPLSRLRYINLGEWNYNWGDRRYEKVKDSVPLDGRIVSLAHKAHEIAQRESKQVPTVPAPFDMAICNLYHLSRPSDRLGGHQDDVESDLTLPLVTISLGAPGVFLLGGNSRVDAPTAILLRAGDCMVMSGRSRGYFHGVPTVLADEANDSFHTCRAATNSVESVEVFPEINERGDSLGKDSTNLPSLMFVKAILSTARMNVSIRQV